MAVSKLLGSPVIISMAMPDAHVGMKKYTSTSKHISGRDLSYSKGLAFTQHCNMCIDTCRLMSIALVDI